MESKNKTKKKTTVNIKDIQVNYIKGTPVDSGTARAAWSMLGSLAVMAVAYLLLGSAMVFENHVLRIVVNVLVIFVCLVMFYANGASRGENAANHGEMMFTRQESGLTVAPEDRKACFHPAKGFIVAFLGSIPVVVAALVLAVIAQRQMSNIGALPSWVESFEQRNEIGNALIYYHQPFVMGLEDVLRVFVRMLAMPVVNICSGFGADALLVMERFSPILMILPGLSYGVGYTQGVNLRKRVHAGIAEGEMKRRKKEKRQRKMQQRQRMSKGPEQLN